MWAFIFKKIQIEHSVIFNFVKKDFVNLTCSYTCTAWSFENYHLKLSLFLNRFFLFQNTLKTFPLSIIDKILHFFVNCFTNKIFKPKRVFVFSQCSIYLESFIFVCVHDTRVLMALNIKKEKNVIKI